ncbi:hypothetical protein KR009_009585 [Drosophila setifemur]|nr:hypothetical protein KR009_009585 [Drosophila setifemur]
MLEKIFPHIKKQPLTERVKSRDAFIYLDRMMYSFGWAEPDEKRWTWVYSILRFITTLSLLVLLPISVDVEYIKRFKNFSANEFLSSLQIGVNMHGCSLKSVYTMLGHKKFKESKKILDSLDQRVSGDEERSKVHRYVALVNLCYIMYLICFNSFILINWLGYLWMGGHAWRMYIPLLPSDTYFLGSSLVELCLMTPVVGMEMCTDVCPTAYMMMARCHINLLKDRLTRLRSDPEKSEDEHISELTKCIQDHRLILDFVNVLRPVFSGTIFVQFLLIGIVLGLSMINVMFFSTFWTTIGNCFFMFDVCLETFPFCYLCNVIIDDCQELSECLFNSNWIEGDRRYKSTLVHFLHNLQQPIVLTAGGVFPICMQTNLSMVKLAFSVVTVMKQFNLAEKFQ